jgi:glycerophosphoryl diester phosphodiesterase
VSAARKRGKQVYAWTVNEPVMMSLMTSRGVDAIITDRPALAREVFAQRAELDPVEKVLLLLAGQIGAEASAQ